MLPVVEDFVTQFALNDFVVVSGSGLMNNKNINLLEEKNYQYNISGKNNL